MALIPSPSASSSTSLPADGVATAAAHSGVGSALRARTPPHFNRLVQVVLLLASLVLASLPFEVSAGEPSGQFVSLLSWLPAELLRSDAAFWLCRGALVVGTLLWLAQRAFPGSCWLTLVSFTALWSLHVETTTNTAHIFNVVNMLLAIQTLWVTADARLIRQRLRAGTYWRLPLVPRWVSLASIAYLGLFHTAAGLSKLAFSGPGWANGTSLQLWAYLWGYPWSPTTRLLVSSRTAAQALQVLTLVFETAGVLALVPVLRPWIGAGLVAFYAGVLLTFPYGFEWNALLTALYLLPCEAWLARWIASRATRQESGAGRP